MIKKQLRKKKKVLMALSGGIDSAVSAYLLIKQGYEVEAAFMKNWSDTTGLKVNECPWLQDRQEALRVAAFLRIPLHTLDFEKQYADTVMKYFFEEYKAGRTPNPDVMCNKEIKFKLLYNWAMENGYEYLATGHYAKIVHSAKEVAASKRKKADPDSGDDIYSLERSTDEFKDQTYFIYNIKTEQLPHVLFPIGHLKKQAVRKLAEKIGLPNAHRKESMGLCFVGKIRLKDFLEQKLKAKKGKIVVVENANEQAIGEHEGLHNYTIGQRQGIKVGGSGPYYVARKDLAKNILYVTHDPNDPALEVREVMIHSLNWISQPQEQKLKAESRKLKAPPTNNLALTTKYSLTGRYRHQGDLVPLTITQTNQDHYLVTFKTPQKAVASGQSLVLYNGTMCVGGGIIA